MKRIVALTLISFIAVSCSNEIKFNTSAFQGTKNYESWIANDFQAAISDSGGVKIIGAINNESLTLSIGSINEGAYPLGVSSVNTAVLEDENFITYSTLNNGDGEIIIEKYDIVNLTITGAFRFNAYSSTGELVNFIDGIFYKTPIAAASSEFAGSNSFSATVNSNILEVDSVDSNISEGQLFIKANHTDNSSIEFFFPENIQLGSHTLNSSTQTYAKYIYADGVVSTSQYGTLTILEHDLQFKKIKASFIFNTAHPHNIAVTNGNFVVFY